MQAVDFIRRRWGWLIVAAVVGLNLWLLAAVGLDVFRHIWYRQMLHIPAYGMLWRIFFVGFRWLGRRSPKWRARGILAWLVPALVLLPVVWLREPLDVAHGGLLIKSYIDFAVGYVGAVALAIWDVWRTTPWHAEVIREIKE